MTYEAVCDFLARDQFLDCCSHEPYLYLKPKPFKSLGELSHEADLFANAKGVVPFCISKGQHKSKSVDQVQPKEEPKQDQRPVVKCKICGKPHPTHKCSNNPDNKRVASSAEFNSWYRGDNSNGVRIGTVVELTNVTIIMIVIITGPNIRSIFVKLKVRM